MTHAIPPGTRDVLPDEMRELRGISSRMRSAFEAAGYGEVHTPALEYEEVLRRGEEHAAGARYRTFDEQMIEQGNSGRDISQAGSRDEPGAAHSSPRSISAPRARSRSSIRS